MCGSHSTREVVHHNKVERTRNMNQAVQFKTDGVPSTVALSALAGDVKMAPSLQSKQELARRLKMGLVTGEFLNEFYRYCNHTYGSWEQVVVWTHGDNHTPAVKILSECGLREEDVDRAVEVIMSMQCERLIFFFGAYNNGRIPQKDDGLREAILIGVGTDDSTPFRYCHRRSFVVHEGKIIRAGLTFRHN